MSLPYYKYFPAEDLGNYQIMSLSHEQMGVWYLLRVCHLWQHQGRIRDDPVYISRLLGLTVEQWESHRQLFLDRDLIQIIDKCVTIAAIREQWEGAAELSEVRSANRKEKLRQEREKKLLRKGKKDNDSE